MTYEAKVVRQTLKIIELLEPALMRKRGRYQTRWGEKRIDGVRAAVFNILVELDERYKEERR